jgi:hypothetical protein
MDHYNTDRARLAANGLLWIEIAFGALSFWAGAFDRGRGIDFVVAALLTAAFGCVSLLASGVVSRFAAARAAGQPLTQGFALACGAVLILVAGGMTCHGLLWVDELADLGPSWLLVVAAFGLSALNTVALYLFVRDMPKPKAEPARASAEETIFGARPVASPTPVFAFNAARQQQRINESLAVVRDRLLKTGT